MSGDRDILAIPDSTAWRAGVQHERERCLRILDDMRIARLENRLMPAAVIALRKAAAVIRETP